LLHGGLVSAVLTAVLALVGASIGLEAVAMGALAASALSSLFWLRCSRRVIGFSWADIAPAVWRSAVVALGASVGPALVYWIYGAAEGQVIAALAWGSAGWVTGFIATAWWMDHPLYDELRRLGRRLRPAAALPARER
jgi:hypothetical protein